MLHEMKRNWDFKSKARRVWRSNG